METFAVPLLYAEARTRKWVNPETGNIHVPVDPVEDTWAAAGIGVPLRDTQVPLLSAEPSNCSVAL
jgi:hypothetical protein